MYIAATNNQTELRHNTTYNGNKNTQGFSQRKGKKPGH